VTQQISLKSLSPKRFETIAGVASALLVPRARRTFDMRRSSFLSLIMVAGIAMAGSALAQDTTRPGDPDPMLQSATGEPGNQPSSPQYDPNRPSADPYRPATDPNRSTVDPNAMDPNRTGDADDPTQRNLPATASNAPVLLLIGAVALGTLAAFLVLRRRGVTNP
jgi:LPXTG-motif cell wall-anchored protein